jgi:peptidoglycan/LPS O-acetylase OafA/YrhL
VEPASTLRRRPELDGLRGAAIVLVVLFHALNYGLGKNSYRGLGSAGVALFFTLSGFLITSLVSADPGLSRFYRNRAVRLLPALLFAILGYWLLQVWLHLELMPGVGWVMGYVANWAMIDGHDLGVFDPAWSLSVEEQFYFLWPLVLLATRRRPRVQLWTTVALLSGTTFARFSLFPLLGESHTYMGSETASASLLVGCLLALLLRQGVGTLRVPGWLLMSGSVAILAFAALGSSPWPFAVAIPTVVSWWTGLLIWARVPLTWRPLRYAGARSYAVYLWHNGILWMTFAVAGHSLTWMAVGVALSFGVAEVSWHLVEQPARRRWHQYTDAERHRDPTEAAPLDLRASDRNSAPPARALDASFGQS